MVFVWLFYVVSWSWLMISAPQYIARSCCNIVLYTVEWLLAVGLLQSVSKQSFIIWHPILVAGVLRPCYNLFQWSRWVRRCVFLLLHLILFRYTLVDFLPYFHSAADNCFIGKSCQMITVNHAHILNFITFTGNVSILCMSKFLSTNVLFRAIIAAALVACLIIHVNVYSAIIIAQQYCLSFMRIEEGEEFIKDCTIWHLFRYSSSAVVQRSIFNFWATACVLAFRHKDNSMKSLE